MTEKISFHCPSCLARIKAPVQLFGRTRNCPGCNASFVVGEQPSIKKEDRPTPPQDAGPMLITESDTVNMLLDLTETKSEQQRRLEELEKENARLKRLLGQRYGSISA